MLVTCLRDIVEMQRKTLQVVSAYISIPIRDFTHDDGYKQCWMLSSRNFKQI